MTKSYHDYIRDGGMTLTEAMKNQSVREAGKAMMTGLLGTHAREGLPADAFAFGTLDAIAVHLVKWYGPVATGEVFHHYAEVCERQKPAAPAEGIEDPATRRAEWEGGDA